MFACRVSIGAGRLHAGCVPEHVAIEINLSRVAIFSLLSVQREANKHIVKMCGRLCGWLKKVLGSGGPLGSKRPDQREHRQSDSRQRWRLSPVPRPEQPGAGEIREQRSVRNGAGLVTPRKCHSLLEITQTRGNADIRAFALVSPQSFVAKQLRHAFQTC